MRMKLDMTEIAGTWMLGQKMMLGHHCMDGFYWSGAPSCLMEIALLKGARWLARADYVGVSFSSSHASCVAVCLCWPPGSGPHAFIRVFTQDRTHNIKQQSKFQTRTTSKEHSWNGALPNFEGTDSMPPYNMLQC